MKTESTQIIELTETKNWDAFVHDHPNGTIFQSSDMAEIYRRTKNFKPISLASISNSGQINAILQAVIINELNGMLSTFSTRSVIEGGPLFTSDERGIASAKTLIEYYENKIKNLVLFTEIRMLSPIKSIDSVLEPYGFIFQEHFNALINLEKPSEALWDQIKRDKKRGIKKAIDSGIIIEECQKSDNLDIVYNLLLETYKNAKMPLPDKSLFHAVFDVLVPKNKAKILFAKYKDEYIATQIALLDNKAIYAWYTGAIRDNLSLHPGDLLIWHLLEWGSKNGLKTFDFGGGGTKTKNLNLRNYKERFGGEFLNYGRYKKIHSPLKMRVAEAGLKVYRVLI
jgi:lipid II:glycine glycyltransferase (peptidoglycan interpeptide bridge formation enzyme)